ncbi:hypothetical protein Tco_0617120 [Tanacetum coccineum]
MILFLVAAYGNEYSDGILSVQLEQTILPKSMPTPDNPFGQLTDALFGLEDEYRNVDDEALVDVAFLSNCLDKEEPDFNKPFLQGAYPNENPKGRHWLEIFPRSTLSICRIATEQQISRKESSISEKTSQFIDPDIVYKLVPSWTTTTFKDICTLRDHEHSKYAFGRPLQEQNHKIALQITIVVQSLQTTPA